MKLPMQVRPKRHRGQKKYKNQKEHGRKARGYRADASRYLPFFETGFRRKHERIIYIPWLRQESGGFRGHAGASCEGRVPDDG